MTDEAQNPDDLRQEIAERREAWREKQEAKSREGGCSTEGLCLCLCHVGIGMTHFSPCCRPCSQCGAKVSKMKLHRGEETETRG